MLGFKLVPPLADQFLDARLRLLRLLDGFAIGDSEPGELLSRIAELTTGDVVELDGQPRFRVNEQDARGRLLKERAIAGLGLLQGLVGGEQLRGAFFDACFQVALRLAKLPLRLLAIPNLLQQGPEHECE